MSSQIQLTISLVLIVLFTVAIVGFGIGYANDNNAAVSIADDTQFSNLYTGNQVNLSEFQEGSTNTYASIVNSTISTTSASGTLENVGPFSLTPKSLLEVSYNSIKIPYRKIFGTDSTFGIFLTTFLSVLALIFGLVLYKTLKGQPD